jgi:hypothetical protein
MLEELIQNTQDEINYELCRKENFWSKFQDSISRIDRLMLDKEEYKSALTFMKKHNEASK